MNIESESKDDGLLRYLLWRLCALALLLTLIAYVSFYAFYRSRNGTYIDHHEEGKVFCIDVGDGDGGRWEIPTFPALLPAMYLESKIHKCSFRMTSIQTDFGKTKYHIGVELKW